MPQVDLETLVSACAGVGGGGGDRKIACETLAAAAEEQPSDDEEEEEKPDLPTPEDFPPESFWLSKDAEYDWFDRNAFFERKDSTKGASNSTNLNPNSLHPNSNSSSQRFSMNLKAKASIIGLPKTQKTSYVVDTAKRRNCKPANMRLFPPKRNESVGKSVAEPSSPKVSCMGRVRSKRGRRKQSEPPTAATRSVEKERSIERKKTGIYRRFLAIFRSKPVGKAAAPPPPAESPPRRSSAARGRADPTVAAEPPGLGGMMRFASGRRSASSWAGDE